MVLIAYFVALLITGCTAVGDIPEAGATAEPSPFLTSDITPSPTPRPADLMLAELRVAYHQRIVADDPSQEDDWVGKTLRLEGVRAGGSAFSADLLGGVEVSFLVPALSFYPLGPHSSKPQVWCYFPLRFDPLTGKFRRSVSLDDFATLYGATPPVDVTGLIAGFGTGRSFSDLFLEDCRPGLLRQDLTPVPKLESTAIFTVEELTSGFVRLLDPPRSETVGRVADHIGSIVEVHGDLGRLDIVPSSSTLFYGPSSIHLLPHGISVSGARTPEGAGRHEGVRCALASIPQIWAATDIPRGTSIKVKGRLVGMNVIPSGPFRSGSLPQPWIDMCRVIDVTE